MKPTPSSPSLLPPRSRWWLCSLLASGLLAGCPAAPITPDNLTEPRLTARAVSDAHTYAPGPSSGWRVGTGPVNAVPVPFTDKQPVQGFSAILDNKDGSFLAMTDNGYGSLENSADFHLRVYKIRPDFKTAQGGRGAIAVESYFELRDPDRHVPFTITYAFTPERVLTGADFDIESMQRAPDGTLWFGDEFGPFLLHTDATGKLLEAPIPLPDFERSGELRTPQNPLAEEASAVRIMNAVRAHARRHGNSKVPVFSPWFSMVNDSNPATDVPNRQQPPAGSGLRPSTSEVFDVRSLQSAGYPVVTWTVNDSPTMQALLGLGVNGIISDRPDLLLEAVRGFDANKDGTPGDLLTADGLIDLAKFDAQGHRGARNLRPENTLPAMEAALDYLMTTLEFDTGISKDGVPILDHDPTIPAQKCRRTDGTPYEAANQVLLKDLTVAEIQSTFICDKLFRGASQLNDPALSPVTAAFAAARGLPHIYALPTLEQVFDFVPFYISYYRSGAGASHPEAARRVKNAERVRYNVETKINPRAAFASRTVAPGPFADAVARLIIGKGLAEQADIQSFDFRTLLHVQEEYPQIRTVYLFGDFPVYQDPTVPGTDDGTNLQTEGTANTPWLAGLYWPYRSTAPGSSFRVQASGGFEGMAITPDGKRLLALLEKPLAGGDGRTLLIHEYDIASRRYTGVTHRYVLEEGATSVGDFILFSDTHGLAIERDNSQGRLDGLKRIYEVKLVGNGQPVQKRLAVDLLKIADPFKIAPPVEGAVGLGETFAFPFVTIEDVVFFDSRNIGVLNDNNFPFSVGRYAGSNRPDDTEFIRIELDQEMGKL
jgi:glycerophosphoryl diester phosphodiesterase